MYADNNSVHDPPTPGPLLSISRKVIHLVFPGQSLWTYPTYNSPAPARLLLVAGPHHSAVVAAAAALVPVAL